ncbi:MAG: ATP-binding protein [Desulfobacterales bacterium]
MTANRRNAELRKMADPIPDRSGEKTDDVSNDHEVYQIELDQQKEELQIALRNLESSRNDYAELYQFTPVGFITLDEKGVIQRLNAAALDILHLPERRLRGLKFSVLIFSEDLPAFLHAIDKIARSKKNGARESIELRIVRDRNAVLYVRLYIGAHFDDGRLVRFHLALTDISETKEMEEELRRSRAELQKDVRKNRAELAARKEKTEKIIDNIPVMIVFYDSNGDLSFINPEAERVLGLSLEEARNIDIMKYCYPDEQYRREVWDFMAAAAPGWKDITMHVAEGKTLESSWANIRLSDGTYIGIGIDIADRKAAEREIDHYIDLLEARNRDLQNFASITSHDLQEPLRKIQSFGNLLEYKFAEELPETARDYLLRMVKSAERMQNLIRALLAYSRISTKPNPFERIDLKTIASEVVNDLALPYDFTKSVVEIGDLPEIEADRVQIAQLLQNLIANGVRYSKKDKGPNIKISCTAKNKNKHCQLCVEDNGIGFDMQYLDRIFLPFERLHGRSEYEGTGMGLAICKRIAERHNGTITAQSRPGEGARFIVTLPRRQNK